MVDVTEVSAIVAAVSVLVGVVYYVLDLRHQRSMREMEMRLDKQTFLRECIRPCQTGIGWKLGIESRVCRLLILARLILAE